MIYDSDGKDPSSVSVKLNDCVFFSLRTSSSVCFIESECTESEEHELQTLTSDPAAAAQYRFDNYCLILICRLLI